MKKSCLLLLLLFSGVAGATPTSGLLLLKECGEDAAVCDAYASELFLFDVYIDNTVASGLEDISYSNSLPFGGTIEFYGFRQDAVFTITETLPSGAWADVQWVPVCTAVEACFSAYDDSIPNQLSFNLTTFANIDTLTLKAVNSLVPIPAAIWLFGSGLLGLVGMARRKKA